MDAPAEAAKPHAAVKAAEGSTVLIRMNWVPLSNARRAFRATSCFGLRIVEED